MHVLGHKTSRPCQFVYSCKSLPLPKEETKDLKKFLRVFPGESQEIALWLRDFCWDLFPECNELIYDNYNALAFGWGLSDRLGDVFCAIAVHNNGVNFGFNKGVALTDPKKILLGNGKVFRFIRVKDKKDFPKAYVTRLLKEAYKNALNDMNGKPELKGATIVKSISPKKKRPK